MQIRQPELKPTRCITETYTNKFVCFRLGAEVRRFGDALPPKWSISVINEEIIGYQFCDPVDSPLKNLLNVGALTSIPLLTLLNFSRRAFCVRSFAPKLDFSSNTERTKRPKALCGYELLALNPNLRTRRPFLRCRAFHSFILHSAFLSTGHKF